MSVPKDPCVEIELPLMSIGMPHTVSHLKIQFNPTITDFFDCQSIVINRNDMNCGTKILFQLKADFRSSWVRYKLQLIAGCNCIQSR